MEGNRFDQEFIDLFLDSEVYAVVGVSTNKQKYGYKVYESLKAAGYTVYAVNPRFEEICGERCYPDLDSLPRRPDVVEFVCPPSVTEETVKALPGLGVEMVWMQPGAESDEAVSFCRRNGIKALHDICVMVEMRKRPGADR